MCMYVCISYFLSRCCVKYILYQTCYPTTSKGEHRKKTNSKKDTKDFLNEMS